MKMRHDFDPALEIKGLNLETKSADGAEGDAPDVTKALGDLTAAVDAKLTESKTAIEAGVATEMKAMRTEIAALKRPGSGGEDDATKAAEMQTKSFWGFVRGGVEVLNSDERKNLIVSDETRGGYLAPAQFIAEIQKELVQISPIRDAARVSQTSAGAVILPRRTGRMTAKWVGETELRPETEPVYGQAEIDVNEMAAYVDVSNWLLEDAAVDLAAELASDFAEEFGRLEGVAFINGDGIKKPVGIMADPSVPVVVNGNATVIQPDALLRLMYDLPAFYRNRGTWLLNGGSIALIRLLKDTTGRYLWQESLADGQPATLMGRPVVEAPDMDNVAADLFPIAYGDINSGYRIFDRVGLSILRDPYTVATEGLVRFHGRKRVGAAVTRPAAIRKLKMAVS